MTLRWLLLVLIPTGILLAAAAHAGPASSLRVQVTDENGLPVRDAVVEFHASSNGSGPIRFPWRMAMAQKNEHFIPGTLIVAKGSTVAFPNLDRVRHSIYSFSKPARFEIDLYGRDQSRSQGFPITGSVKLGCNIHDQMRGYIRVTDTPFAAKTDHNGYVDLGSIPSGAGKLTIWHPRLRAPANEMKQKLTLRAGAQSRKVKVRLR
ncbi:hypothetical protein SAMN06297468_1003 [Altererythrobacter xiamenensis]|uniref:Plastocyanin n=1 Tax=Altererythrobacter xiamenensis TaxID=1316679 RepID=A0A1Y6ENZ5_9SPHN|nr:hypothetical protein SAMN06297468_1003 [Altererythrobacter xiamenensis]